MIRTGIANTDERFFITFLFALFGSVLAGELR
jgi:hypothetical protein